MIEQGASSWRNFRIDYLHHQLIWASFQTLLFAHRQCSSDWEGCYEKVASDFTSMNIKRSVVVTIDILLNPPQTPAHHKRSRSYTLLNLDPEEADAKSVRRAYREAVRNYHPDKCETPVCARQYREIREAYESVIKQHVRH